MVQRARNIKQPRVAPELANRVPPGQFVTERWPVLHHGPVPTFDPLAWDLCVSGLVTNPLRFTWKELGSVPRTIVHADMHCVTRWSKLDNAWEGIAIKELIARAGVHPEAHFVLFHGDGGYTANLPRDVVDDDEVLLALAHNGQVLTPEHGFPLRLVVPQRYAWKSVKWLREIEFGAEDRLGFWERYGYNSGANPWKQERFAE